MEYTFVFERSAHSFYFYLFFNRLLLLLVSISRSGTLQKYFMIANIYNFYVPSIHFFIKSVAMHVYRHFVAKPRAYCRLVTGIVGDEGQLHESLHLNRRHRDVCLWRLVLFLSPPPIHFFFLQLLSAYYPTVMSLGRIIFFLFPVHVCSDCCIA